MAEAGTFVFCDPGWVPAADKESHSRWFKVVESILFALQATREVFDEDFFIYEAKVKMCPRKAST